MTHILFIVISFCLENIDCVMKIIFLFEYLFMCYKFLLLTVNIGRLNSNSGLILNTNSFCLLDIKLNELCEKEKEKVF